MWTDLTYLDHKSKYVDNTLRMRLSELVLNCRIDKLRNRAPTWRIQRMTGRSTGGM